MREYLGEIESWMQQVRDDSLGVDDYDFLDRLEHGGKDGNNGLGNVGAYLAFYEEENEEGETELKVDRELIEELDSRQAVGRNRFTNIILEGDTKKREDNTLVDNYSDEDVNAPAGHQRLETMIDAFREEGNLDAESPQEANTTEVEGYEDDGPMTFTLDITGGDSEMTEDNADNNYDKAMRTLNTAGGYALAGATGIFNLPATALGVAADRLEGENDTISSKPENESESYGGDNNMVSDDVLEQAAAERTEAIADVSDNLAEAGATVDQAVDAASNAASAYFTAKGDRDEARELLEETYNQDSEMFGYAADALEDINSTLEDEVVNVLSGLNPDSYDLTDVKREMDAAERIWNRNLPDDPSDITNY